MLLLERISDSVFLSSLFLLRCIEDKKSCKKKKINKKLGKLLQAVYFVRIFMFGGLSYLSIIYMCCIQKMPLLDFKK